MQKLLIVLACLALLPMPRALAQGRICPDDGEFEPASETLRTVELPDFGIAVAIPSNYRTMKRQDGSISILHPDDFALLQCVAQGGYGARGYYHESIQLVSPDPAMSLRDQAIWSVGYQFDAAGRRIPAYSQIRAYNHNGISGYLVESISGYGVTFLGTYPGSNQLLEVSAACDCPVEMQDVETLLSHLTVLD
ncbi:hypothetical protein [Nodosilinea sp. P-1105]|uniref:hypothetical protein n=1 Tax=Nodosilinea sp. P-1105 TaxID=2546229 RepID=UPI00197DFAA5|nr:hypothetical protein [Nodosilinea sp. P-1105]